VVHGIGRIRIQLEERLVTDAGKRGLRSHTACHSANALIFQFFYLPFQNSSRTRTEWLLGIRVVEADEEERYIIFPWYPSERAEVWYSDDVVVTIFLIANLQLLEVCLVVHIPSKDHRTEAKALLCDAEELLLRHQLTPQLPIDVDTGNLDLGVIVEDIGDVFERHRSFRHNYIDIAWDICRIMCCLLRIGVSEKLS
jgi:hypothetical protein